MNVFVEKYILISGFLAFLGIKVLEKVLILMFAWSVQMISGLDSQSKFQMFTLFFGRHVGVPWRYTNMAAPYWALWICAKYFDKYLKVGKMYRLNNWRSILIICLLQYYNFLSLFTVWFPNYFLIAWGCIPRITISQLWVVPENSVLCLAFQSSILFQIKKTTWIRSKLIVK